jgi:chemotaxis protein MotA
MFIILGIVVVIGAITGGYLLEKGNLLVLLQPAELLIIGGAAIGTLLIANPFHVLKRIIGGVVTVLKPGGFSQAFYLDVLKMLNEIFVYARKGGMAKLEPDLDEPTKSALLSKHKCLMKDHEALEFLCDSLRVAVDGIAGPFELDQLMEMDMEVQHHAESVPVAALNAMADSLPGLGIVAAVLGVVITMGALGGPPEEIGHKVAAALVGTFLGILMCYGFVGPIAASMAKAQEERGHYLRVLRTGVMSFVKGMAPAMAVEFARRTIPPHARPSFKVAEATIKGKSVPEAA